MLVKLFNFKILKAIIALGFIFPTIFTVGPPLPAANDGVPYDVTPIAIEPEFEWEYPAVPLPGAELEERQLKLLSIREQYTDQVDNHVGESENLRADYVAPTNISDYPGAGAEAYLKKVGARLRGKDIDTKALADIQSC